MSSSTSSFPRKMVEYDIGEDSVITPDSLSSFAGETVKDDINENCHRLGSILILLFYEPTHTFQ